MLYIQRREGKCLETVSQCETRKEARHEVREYQFGDPSAYYYISVRACKAWYADGGGK